MVKLQKLGLARRKKPLGFFKYGTGVTMLEVLVIKLVCLNVFDCKKIKFIV